MVDLVVPILSTSTTFDGMFIMNNYLFYLIIIVTIIDDVVVIVYTWTSTSMLRAIVHWSTVQSERMRRKGVCLRMWLQYYDTNIFTPYSAGGKNRAVWQQSRSFVAATLGDNSANYPPLLTSIMFYYTLSLTHTNTHTNTHTHTHMHTLSLSLSLSLSLPLSLSLSSDMRSSELFILFN